jgi:hypothetical protein
MVALRLAWQEENSDKYESQMVEASDIAGII